MHTLGSPRIVSFSAVAALAALAAAPRSEVPGQGSKPARLPQRILYVGDTKNPRAAAFREFLGSRFASVESAERTGFDPKKADDCDVVVLDWPQTPITAANIERREEVFPPKVSPLGERSAWKKPTVLLGSAGLMLSCVWGLKAGSG